MITAGVVPVWAAGLRTHPCYAVFIAGIVATEPEEGLIAYTIFLRVSLTLSLSGFAVRRRRAGSCWARPALGNTKSSVPYSGFRTLDEEVCCAVPGLLCTETGCSGYDAGLGSESIHAQSTRFPAEEVLSERREARGEYSSYGNEVLLTFE